MNVLVPMPIVLPLLGAALSLAFLGRTVVQRVLGLATMIGTVAGSIALLVRVATDAPVAVGLGGWPPGIGITLVADLFATLMLVVSSTMVLAVLVYAIGSPGTADHALFFHPLYLVLAAGVSASFLTGDLFNLFVAFEVMLSASYVLMTLGGRADQIRSAMTYVVISLLASTLFVTAIGLIYAATGTVDLAELARRMPELPAGVRGSLGLLLLIVFGIKAAIFPLFFWLPDSYPTAPTPVTAIFAGLLTKVGVYAIVRTQTLLFPSDGPSTLLLGIAAATMLIGVLGAIAQDDIKRILSFHIVSQIGYMILGLALFTVAGVAAAIFYIVHHIVVKTTLFLVGGIVEHATGTGALHRLSGLVTRMPVTAVLFLLPALSLAGLPPFSGFVAKLGLVEAGLGQQRNLVVGVSLLVSLLTLFSMTKIWAGAFWGTAGGDGTAEGSGKHLAVPALMVAPTAALVVLSLAIAAGAGPIHDLSRRAAEGLLNPGQYAAVVASR